MYMLYLDRWPLLVFYMHIGLYKMGPNGPNLDGADVLARSCEQPNTPPYLLFRCAEAGLLHKSLDLQIKPTQLHRSGHGQEQRLLLRLRGRAVMFDS